MMFSTRARYGLKAVVDLANEYGNGPQPLSALAKKQGISESYLEQLLRTLRQAHIVDAIRGINGGYVLAREPVSISVESVLEVLEGSTAVADCVSSDGGVCQNACTCSTRPLFLKLQAKINAVLAETSILDLATDHTEQKKRIEDAKNIS
ncbi:MAG: Rrf2 family transcriptional regulator [Eubacteriales bacterium]|nr:Rrf2 family transcriptional regulator [Eubacteriales bacterium]